jgi:hypothetical protein
LNQGKYQMTITAKIILDSISPQGIRLTTMQLRYPRFIHAEFMTHRVFSRNASSSRAIPVKRLIEDLRRDPAMPIYWGRNKPGMQAGEDWHELVSVPTASGGIFFHDRTREEAWLDLMETSIKYAEAFDESEYHKQIVNRLLEPWAHINVVVTATQYSNFFALRSHPDAQPEIKLLSDHMRLAMCSSVPSSVEKGQWHLPYVLGSDWQALRAFAKKNRITRDEPQHEELVKLALMVSVARCARVSYKTHDGRETSVEEDIELAHKLVVSTPLHASPAEHQATPDKPYWFNSANKEYGWQNPKLHGNLNGWKQHRKMLPNEFVEG